MEHVLSRPLRISIALVVLVALWMSAVFKPLPHSPTTVQVVCTSMGELMVMPLDPNTEADSQHDDCRECLFCGAQTVAQSSPAPARSYAKVTAILSHRRSPSVVMSQWPQATFPPRGPPHHA
jgi:hypothetical protein